MRPTVVRLVGAVTLQVCGATAVSVECHPTLEVNREVVAPHDDPAFEVVENDIGARCEPLSGVGVRLDPNLELVTEVVDRDVAVDMDSDVTAHFDVDGAGAVGPQRATPRNIDLAGLLFWVSSCAVATPVAPTVIAAAATIIAPSFSFLMLFVRSIKACCVGWT